MSSHIIEIIQQELIVPVVVIEDADSAVVLADALLEAGLHVIEVTFRTPAAAQAIYHLARKRPEMHVGAGTLLAPDHVLRAKDAGAKFGLAPGLNPRVVEAAQKVGLDFAPGVVTPSEVELGLELGCKLQKFFPAEQSGGVGMLKALEGPYGHTGIRFIPTGGINQSNMKNYLALESVVAIGGSWFVEKKLIAAGDWNSIIQLSRSARVAAQS